MKKHIAEELPERKHAPAAAPVARSGEKPGAGKPDDHKGGKEAKSPEARVRQAVYDIRYRARREELPLQQAYSQYMQHSNMSQQEKTLVKQKLFGKGGMKAEDFNIVDFASDNVANALYRVFVEDIKEEEPIVLTYMEKLETAEHRKYKVRVTGKDGRSYVRYATRDKISSLRANPNIQSVEMTEYGEPYEGEKKKGEQTARAKAGKGLDPVGKEDADVNNDGKVDKTDKYLQHRRDVRGDAIAKKGVKEEFIGELVDKLDTTGTKEKPIDVMGKNEKNTVTLNPDIPGTSKDSPSVQLAHTQLEGPVIAETGYTKFLDMLQERKMTKKEKQKEEKLGKKTKEKALPAMQQEYGKEKGTQVYYAWKRKKAMSEESECGCDEQPKTDSGSPCEDDSRSIPTKVNLLKNKLRAMGLKCSYEPEGEVIDELNRQERERGEKSGGTSDPVERFGRKLIRGLEGRPAGQRKRPRGKKPPAAGEWGAERESPADTVKKRRAAAQRATELMSSPRD